MIVHFAHILLLTPSMQPFFIPLVVLYTQVDMGSPLRVHNDIPDGRFLLLGESFELPRQKAGLSHGVCTDLFLLDLLASPSTT
jgi:hypothetical protein